MTAYNQWIRKIGLFIVNKSVAMQGSGGISTSDGQALDLSAFRIKFSIQNADVESPNTCSIRVYNLSPATVRQIRGEYGSVILNAGYENGNYGIVFQGTIMQFKIGRENATDSFLDIYSSDGDIGYNQGLVNTSLAKGATPGQVAQKITDAMPGLGSDFGSLTITKQNVPNIRGTVLMGMARARLRNLATSLDSGWSIQDGKVVITSNTGYRDGEAVVINSGTGMIGTPEQTDSGIKVVCLLNSKIRIGGRVKLNNDEIVQLMQANPNAAPIAYNQWAGFQALAPLSGNGMYRAFSVEHEGDNRGGPWYTQLTCLAVNETAPPAQSVAPQ
jgi:hypothetical protein